MLASIIKWSLLVLISMTILTMLGLPGCYPSTRTRMQAFSEYHDSPNEKTKEKLEAAKRAEWKGIAVMEVLLAVFLGFGFFAYARISRLADKDEN